MTSPGADGLDAVRETDVVVVGAGAAGLSAALGLAGRRVDLLSKGPLAGTGNSPWAQGGVAVAVGEGDTPALHAADTLAVAGAIGDPRAVAWLTAEGPARLADLLALGARFDRDSAGRLHLAREAAHSRRRILHARDATGAEIVRALRGALGGTSGLSVFERAFCLELVSDASRVTGVLARHADGAVVLHRSRAVVLATGGLGRAYERTTNPAEATGDGLALAWRAGARLADLEFVQFHPTALDVGEDPLPLLTEALRGAGARLVDEDGRFLLEGGDLQPRDVVARGLWRALASGGRAFLDAREAVGESFPGRFPTVFEACRSHGLDPRLEPIPVAPAAHYHMGGVLTDLDGRTSRPGLWAAGEVACTGVHGANRLASNSLLEALVFGAAVARSVKETLRRAAPPSRRAEGTVPAGPKAWAAVRAGSEGAGEVSAETAARVAKSLRHTMWERVGLVRDASGLEGALRALEDMERELRGGTDREALRALEGPESEPSVEGVDPAPLGRPGAASLRAPLAVLEARNLLTVARLVSTAALARTESRGAHFRSDHPAADPAWRLRLVVTRSGEDVRISADPVADPAATRGVSA